MAYYDGWHAEQYAIGYGWMNTGPVEFKGESYTILPDPCKFYYR